jgi:hypothetical protein
MQEFEEISLTFVRDRVKKFYDIPHTLDDVFIDLMLMDAVRKFLSYKYVTQKCLTLDVCDCKAELPCDYKRIICLMSPCEGDEHGRRVYVYYDGPCGDLGDLANNYQGSFNGTFKIQDNYLKFPSNFEADQVVIYYDAYKTGEDGFPVLMKTHVDYFFNYACAWYGFKIKDPRYAVFEKKAKNNKLALLHNENVDWFEIDKVALRAVINSLGTAGAGFSPYGYFSSPYGPGLH